jgi:hypothetical protein
MIEERKKTWIVLVVIALAVVGLLLFYFLYFRPSQEAPPSVPPAAEEKPSIVQEKPEEKVVKAIPPPVSPQPKAVEEKPSPPAPIVKMEESDGWIRQNAKNLSPHPRFLDWLKVGNFIRIITVVVDNVAEGKSPRSHLGFLAPGKGFEVMEKEKKLYLDPSGYKRYDPIGDVFSSLDTQKVVQTYKVLKPLFQQAYRELGYPKKDFQDTLMRAIIVLLLTPAVQGDILLEEEERGINYRFADQELEGLMDAQKHLIRMGPDNSRKIQSKLFQIAVALGAPQDKLPKPRVYATTEKKD